MSIGQTEGMQMRQAELNRRTTYAIAQYPIGGN